MTTRLHTILALLLILLTTSATAQWNNTLVPTTLNNSSSLEPQEAQQVLDNQSPVFIENKGQWDRQAKFLLRSNGLDMWITDRGVRYDLYTTQIDQSNEATNNQPFAIDVPLKEPAPTTRTGHVVAINFVGASFVTNGNGTGKQLGYYNYFLGNDSSKWATNVARYSGARIEQLYNGIDAVFYLDQGRPRYDLVVAAGADASQIQMKVEGGNGVSVGADGSLQIATTMGMLQQRGLYAYQNINGTRQQVECRFVVNGRDGVRFHVGSYDRTRALVIDPLVYSTYLGGSSSNSMGNSHSIVLDASGNAYITGSTKSSDYPTTTGAYDVSFNSAQDVIVTKLNPTGDNLLYSTFIGGSGDDLGNGIALDVSGHIYITGTTMSLNYPTTGGAFDVSLDGTRDVFVTKLNATGDGLIYSTLLGGNSNDRGYAIAIDTTGNAYVTGSTESNNFPTTSGAFDVSRNGIIDAFATKLNAAGNGLIYSTFIGGTDGDGGWGIAIDASGNAYIIGHTQSSDYPTTTGAYDVSYNDYEDVFVTKLNADGSDLIYSTFIGGADDDNGRGIAIDAIGNVYVVGITRSTNFPMTIGAYDTSFNGEPLDVFVTKLNAVGSDLIYSTFIGGIKNEISSGIVLDATGNAYITGYTTSNDYPMTTGAYDPSFNIKEDAFVTKLNAEGTALSYSTFIGGGDVDRGTGITIDADNNIYITGTTASIDYPTTAGAYNASNSGGDVFVTKLSLSSGNDQSVELASFTLSSSNLNVLVSWRTAREANNAGFEVQRSTQLDTTFLPIASYLSHPELVGLGTSSQGKDYSLTDQDLVPGVYRYRLVDVTNDGIRTIHPEKSITLAASSVAFDNTNRLLISTVAPNPANDDVQVSYSLPVAMTVTVEVYTVDGRILATPLKSQPRTQGNHNETISVAELAPGVYTLRLIAGNGSRTYRCVVVR